MKRNPLSPTPPDPKSGKRHRVGSNTDRNLRELFGHLGSQFDDIHRGVFITEQPIVAYTYAWSRQEDGENDFGLEDVVDPPVLIGLQIPTEDEFIDTDAMVTAKELLNMAQLLQQEETQDDEDEESEAMEYASDVTRDRYFDLETYGLAGLGGMIGNISDKMKFYRAAIKISQMLVKMEVPLKEELVEMPDAILEQALDEASVLIPQSRLLREVEEAEVVSILVVTPIRNTGYDAEEKGYPTEDPSEGDAEGELDTANIALFNQYMIDKSKVLYMKPGGAMRDVNRWHGTSLSVAREAFPDIVTFARYIQGQQFGSAYDWDELEDGRAEEEEQ